MFQKMETATCSVYGSGSAVPETCNCILTSAVQGETALDSCGNHFSLWGGVEWIESDHLPRVPDVGQFARPANSHLLDTEVGAKPEEASTETRIPRQCFGI